jgi:UDP-N-acetylmuramoyl-tripeptide--D-alanyl-D-alanine ligase
MSISQHPIWKNVSPYKKPLHLLRFQLAKQIARRYPRNTFIGITGSVGKTTTTECCLAVLSEKYTTLASTQAKVVNLDPIFNIPLILMKMRKKIQKVIFEMGIEYPGDMDFYLTLVRPGIGILTRVFYAHSQFLGGVDKIFEEKSKLIAQLPKDGYAILNFDDPLVRKAADLTEAQVIWFGTDPKHCQIYATKIRIEDYQTKFEINYGVERVEVGLKLLGRHQVTPALAAATLGVVCDMNLISIKRGLEKVVAAEHRLQLQTGMNGFMVLDDTYNNASPIGIEAAIDVLCELTGKKRILVFNEMKELGEFSEKMHRQVAQKIAKEKIDFVILGGGDTKYIAEELESLGYPTDKIVINPNHQQIVSAVLKIAGRGDIVLVKGSRSSKMEDVVKRIIK